MNSAKKVILFGAGIEGRKAFEKLGEERIYCFADNNKANHEKTYLGKNILSFSEYLKVYRNYQTVLSVNAENFEQIKNQLLEAGISEFMCVQEYVCHMNHEGNPQVQALKDIYKGQRCFIIGTGPSLRIEDLETLKRNGAITFASNKIFKIFGNTEWRPNLYCCIDNLVLEQYWKDILQIHSEQMFLCNLHGVREKIELTGKSDALQFVDLIMYREAFNVKFSWDCSKYIIDGYSVTYSMIQLAVYMGFKEIYLLGIDFNYKDNVGKENPSAAHFCKDYDNEGEKFNVPRLDICGRAYETAEKISMRSDFRIYNATRGGKLEVFERVDFDTLFKEK